VQSKNLICLVIDRLHAGMVGAYGNSWIKTRRLDRLACESFVFDQAFADDTRLERLYRGYWFGIPAAVDDSQAIGGQSLPAAVRAAGLRAVLITDEPAILAIPAAGDFSERIVVEPGGNRTRKDASQTRLARLLDTAADWLAAQRSPFFLWVHARGLAAPWDAPWEFRERYADEEDPEPPRFRNVPDHWLAESYDPDELLGINQAYSGQVSLLDDCLRGLSDWLAGGGLANATQFTLLSARGFPLGEHLRVGACDAALYNETVQIPWFMRFPDGLGSLARSQALVQPSDLPGTLLEWLELDRNVLGQGSASSLLDIIRGKSDFTGDRIRFFSLHDRAIRTPAWYLRQPETGPAELYAKPGDRWEVNEVAKLLPEIVSGLQAALAQSDPASDANPLPEALTTEVD
jgi:arylsulfatase A-like enzyme